MKQPRRHTFGEYVAMAALFAALTLTVFLALAGKVEFR